MFGVRFLDADFIRINLACGCRAVKLIRLFCTVVNEERLHGAHRDRNPGWRRRSGRAAWWRGPRANLIFVLPPNVYVGPPVGGTFWFQIFLQAPSPEIWSETISGGEKVLAAKWGGLFWATSLEKIFGGVTAIISFRPGGSTALSTCIYGTSTSRSCQNRAQQSLGRGECASASRFPFGSSQNILWRGRNSMIFATGCP